MKTRIAFEETSSTHLLEGRQDSLNYLGSPCAWGINLKPGLEGGRGTSAERGGGSSSALPRCDSRIDGGASRRRGQGAGRICHNRDRRRDGGGALRAERRPA